jgi:GT2 family glycosyltransferase
MRDLTIIIVNWNTGPLLSDCLDSLSRFAPAGLSWEAVVVDNASTDGSETAACRGGERVRLIRKTENAGFSRANNEAIRATQSRHVLLLNPDTVFIEDCIGPLLARLEQDPTIGMIACRLVNEDRAALRDRSRVSTAPPCPEPEPIPRPARRYRLRGRDVDRGVPAHAPCRA